MSTSNKILQLLSSPDLANQKLGYSLARHTLNMSDEDIIWLILNGTVGWYTDHDHNFFFLFTLSDLHIYGIQDEDDFALSYFNEESGEAENVYDYHKGVYLSEIPIELIDEFQTIFKTLE